MIALVTFLVLLALGLAASRWGADSRDGRDWQPLQLETKPRTPAPRRVAADPGADRSADRVR